MVCLWSISLVRKVKGEWELLKNRLVKYLVSDTLPALK